ncbi:MAG: hypothetical protein NTW98_02725 [Candidatus Nomurabacteria bacterium]|nr:hypothetical protein [Candidatus Nomurabacteria bacterium]
MILIFLAFLLFFIAPVTVGKIAYEKGEKLAEKENKESLLDSLGNVLGEETEPVLPTLDTTDYDRRMTLLANNPPQPSPTVKKTKNPDGTFTETIIPAKVRIDKWPVKTVYPKTGAILPFNRIVAYYGNLYSKKMGVLGEYSEDIMLAKLQAEVKKWNDADPGTPAIPALHYIATVAQGSAGADGKYRFKMPDTEIDKVLKMAEKIDAIVFLDIQVALSNIQTELPKFEKYLKMPNVHLGIDPEFSMKTGAKPGKVVGTMDGELDVNYSINYLSKLVKDNNLPPKILIVHRYTKNMLTNTAKIKPTEEVQVVIHMDGWGPKANKIGTYKHFIVPEPVQFTGFKIFYKNDVKTPNSVNFVPSELLKLSPRPIYIQYQ